MELREPAPPSVFSPQEFFQAEDFSGAQPIYTRGFTLSTEKHFKRKQGVLARLVGSLNFLITEDTGTREMRACPRLEFRAEVTYVSQKGTTDTGFLVDISKTGLQLETERKLPKGITLALNAPDRDEVEENIPFMARVKWTRKVGDKFRAGLALPQSAVDDEHWLEVLLEKLGYREENSTNQEETVPKAE